MYNVHLGKTPVLVVDIDGKITEYKTLQDLTDYWNDERDGDLRWNEVKYVLDALRTNSYVYAKSLYYEHVAVIIKPTEAF